jgi:glycosyltransferase involved in cell wall biosynthesis
MKRILIFSLTYFPYVGGAEVAMKEITDRLDPHEYAFEMITLRFDSNLPKVEKVGNITVHRIGFTVPDPSVSDRAMPWQLKLAKVLFPVMAFAKALQLHRKNAYLLTWALMANQSAFAALFFKWTHPRVPYYLELQDGRALSDMKKRQPLLALMWPLYTQIYLQAEKIKAISNFIAREVRAIGYTKPIEVIPNAVDVTKFSQPISLERSIELERRFGKKMGDVFLFTASRLVLSRGMEDTIRALTFLPDNVKLLIAGTGEDQHKLEHIAHEGGVDARVIFAGHVAHDTLPALYKISDIFVRPSIIEGFGNAFVEAFAAGIPIIATPVGGIPDFLTEGETGLFCDVHNPESIARAVQRYMENPVLLRHVVENSKRLVAEKYDWSVITEAMKKRVFEPLIG